MLSSKCFWRPFVTMNPQNEACPWSSREWHSCCHDRHCLSPLTWVAQQFADLLPDQCKEHHWSFCYDYLQKAWGSSSGLSREKSCKKTSLANFRQNQVWDGPEKQGCHVALFQKVSLGFYERTFRFYWHPSSSTLIFTTWWVVAVVVTPLSVASTVCTKVVVQHKQQ